MSVLLFTVSTGFVSNAYQKAYGATNIATQNPASDSATRISAWIKELFPHPDVKVIFVTMTLHSFPPDMRVLGAGSSRVMLEEPCNTTNGAVRGDGVSTGFGIVHGNIEVTCLAHPPIPDFEIGIQVDSPEDCSRFDISLESRTFYSNVIQC